MKKLLLLSILLSFLSIQFLWSQEFDTKEQYTQAMQNAKQAFDAQQFSEAVMFYREAIKINPDARLPKYKIEDIRTIYIEKELDSITAIIPTSEKKKRKKKKDVEAEKVLLAEIAKVEATRKMNEDADKVQEELKTLNVSVIEIDEDLNKLDSENDLLVDDIEGDKEVLIKKLEIKTQSKFDEVKQDSLVIALQVGKAPKVIAETEKYNEEKIVHEANSKSTIVTKTPSNTIKKEPTKKVDKKVWVEKETDRLINDYPNKKTIEEVDKPGKHITRVIMNIDNKVIIYLKVKHSWGATFFFIDEVGQELKSISESYFNLKTNLKTYGG